MTELNQARKQYLDKLLAERSLYHFVNQAWSYIDSNVFLDNWHIRLICDHLQAVFENKIDNLIINIPPGYAKSLLTSVMFPAWIWIKNPSCRLLTGSYASDLAIRDTRKSRMLLSSNWYQDNWGDKWVFKSDENRKQSYENDKQGSRVAFSVGGSITGKRGDIRIFDDPADASDSFNKTALSSINNWFSTTFSTRIDITKPSKTIIIMQRLSENDLTGFLLENQANRWVHLCLPLEYEPRRHCRTCIGEDIRTEAGQKLMNIISDEQIARLKANLGSYGRAGQLQQRPAPDEGGIFKKQFFGFYDQNEKHDFDLVIQCYDTAEESKDHSDYSVCLTAGITQNMIYLMHLWHDKVDILDLLKKSKLLSAEFKPNLIVIEKKASGTQLLQMLNRETRLPIHAYNPAKNKITRARMSSPTVEAGRLLLPKGAFWVDSFLDEVITFPNSAHDDITDALSMLINFLNEKVGDFVGATQNKGATFSGV